VKSIAFFNNKGGVGKTSLVYHLGWTFADLGRRVLMVDLDPQSNLTAMSVDEDRLEQLWVDDDEQRLSIRGAIQPIIGGIGDIRPAHQEAVSNRLMLLPGDIRLSEFEAKLWDAWPRCLDRDPAAFRVTSALYRVIQTGATSAGADLVLIDVGPNLGAINRSALIAADNVVVPLGADLFSIQGLRNLGPTLVDWHREWQERLARNPVPTLPLPAGAMLPVGYVVMQPNLYGGQVTRAYQRWLAKLPSEYARSIEAPPGSPGTTVDTDPCCLAVLRHYRSLMPMAQTARKPIFKLTPADGVMGAHAESVLQIGAEFRALASRIDDRTSPASVDATHGG